MSVFGLRFVITGAAEGMGAATALMAASRGASVVLSDVNDEEGERIAKKIGSLGGKALYLRCDVTDDDAINELMTKAAQFMGGIDVLHNNAGVIDSAFGDYAAISLESYSREVWDKVIAINLSAPLFTTKAALPYLKESSNGSVIIAASTASYVGNPSTLAYGASKGGVALLAKNLAVELARYKVRCNAYCPGVINTGLVKRYLQSTPNPEELIQNFISSHLVRRMGEADEVAELVCFLAGDKSRFVNGVAWPIDGGMLAWRQTADVIGLE